MSNLAQSFLTAPRIKIYVDNQPLAYAVGFNINLSVSLADVNVIGSYAPIAQEAVQYNVVSGSMQIVRVLNQNTQTTLNTLANAAPQLTSAGAIRPTTDFNALGTDGQVVAPSGTANSVTTGLLARHLSPERVLLSKSFQIRLFLKVPNIGDDGQPVITPANPQGLKEIEFMVINDCRITSDSVSISMGSLVSTPVSFQGLLATPSVDGVVQFQSDSIVRQSVVPGQ